MRLTESPCLSAGFAVRVNLQRTKQIARLLLGRKERCGAFDTGSAKEPRQSPGSAAARVRDRRLACPAGARRSARSSGSRAADRRGAWRAAAGRPRSANDLAIEARRPTRRGKATASAASQPIARDDRPRIVRHPGQSTRGGRPADGWPIRPVAPQSRSSASVGSHSATRRRGRAHARHEPSRAGGGQRERRQWRDRPPRQRAGQWLGQRQRKWQRQRQR